MTSTLNSPLPWPSAVAATVGRAVRWLFALLGLALRYVGDFFSLAHAIVKHILAGEVTRRELGPSMWRCAVTGVPLVMATVGASGMVFALYTAMQFRLFGASEMIGGMVSLSMAREIGPVLTATVIAARTGSAIAAEVSSMVVTEQIDALRALATDPVEYLAAPRYVAMALMLPLVTLFGIGAGIAGAALVCSAGGIPLRQFYNSMIDWLPANQLVTGCVKAVVFGELIAVASLHQGFRCGHGSAAVGRATTRAVVLALLWIHTANLLLAVAAN